MKFKWGENTAFRLLALFLAIVLWVYVTHQRNPVLERVARISLQQQGLSDSMIIQDIPPDVTVYYRSSMGRLALVSPGEFTARVNLTGLEAGRHSLPVLVQAPSGVEVVRVNPQRVTVVLDKIREKNVSVAVNVLGTPAPGYRRLDPVVTPPVVKVVGPGQLLQEIKKVAVSVDIRGTPTGIERVLPVSTGVRGVELHPDSVKVTVPVEPLPARTVTVEPSTTGNPAEGFRVENLTIEPSTVQVTGTQELLDGLDGLQTEPLDISGASSDMTGKVNVVIPSGVSSVTPRQVEVTARIVPGDVKGQDEGGLQPGESEVSE